MDKISPIVKFLCAPHRQEVELQQVEHEAGYTTIRVRIRELKRFTIFDIDAATAAQWGEAMLDWSKRQKNSSDSKD